MLPPKSDYKWKDLVTGQTTYQFQSLATKILMNRLLVNTKNNSSPENIDKCIEEAYKFFEKNERIIQSDVKQIFG